MWFLEGRYLAILSEVSNIESMCTWNGKGPSLLLPGKNIPTNEANPEESRAKNCVNQYSFFFLFNAEANFSRVTGIYNQKDSN